MENLRHILIAPYPPLLFLSAIAADIIAGDPRRIPHPVTWIGSFIASAEKLLRRSGLDTYPGGILLCLSTVAVTTIAASSVLLLASFISEWLCLITATWMAWTTIAARSLHRESSLVAMSLKNGDIEEARRFLSYIVGRDTSELDEEAIWRATIETVAENTSDGVIAPMFWLAIGGPVAAMAYKAASTLDSMVGYRNEKYERMGWASARLDDLLNLIPARFTALTIILAAPLAGLSFRNSLKIWLRDCRNHASPNSGHPEAAAAGALGVRLGGPSRYGGMIKEKPFIGDPSKNCNMNGYRGVIRLMYISAAITAVILMTLTTLWSRYGI